MPIARLIPTIIALLLLAAHFLHRGYYLLIPVALAAPLLLLLKLRPAIRLLQILLVVAAVEWVYTGITTAQERIAYDKNPVSALIIDSAVAAFTLFAAVLLQSRRVLDAYPHESH